MQAIERVGLLALRRGAADERDEVDEPGRDALGAVASSREPRLELGDPLACRDRLRIAPLRRLELLREALGVVGAEHGGQRRAALGRPQLALLQLRQPLRSDRPFAREGAQLLDVADERLVGVRDARLGHPQIPERRHQLAPARGALGQCGAHRAGAAPRSPQPQRREACEQRSGQQRHTGARECECERREDAAEQRRRAHGDQRDVRDRRARRGRRAFAAGGGRLQVGELHCLERRGVGLAQGVTEHARREVVAADRLALGARALDAELIALALVARSRQRGLANRRRMLDQQPLALAEVRGLARRLDLAAQLRELARALVGVTAQRLQPLARLVSDARRQSVRD